MPLLQLLATTNTSYHTLAIFAAVADVAITMDNASFATRVALAILVVRAALANLVACAALEIRVVLQMLFLVVCIILVYAWSSIGSRNCCLKLKQKYENKKETKIISN